ncbi:ATP synthase F1 subunit delta [Blattabacterium cuenoti]|uniref:ATP synthase F1 subunit delta n=1 Tax=Blattabacterium cuenoti TaxID=1653831 RepID=UPI00163CD6D2|nr:ATP synthase F1 subunit delta [Blattabacterium cuenoti]
MFSNKKIVRHYAKIFFEYSNGNDLFYEKVKKVSSLLYNNVYINRILYTSLLNSEKKIKIFKKIFYPFDILLYKFIQLLIIRKREFFFKEILLEYKKIYKKEKKGLIKCIVISAFPLSMDMQKLIIHQIKIMTKYDKKFNIINKTDPSIIGGFLFRIEYEYKEWNFSIREQLFCIKKIFKNSI